MSSEMIFRGAFVFETKDDMASALLYFEETELGAADFTIDGLAATIAFDGMGPYHVYEDLLPAFEQTADHAVGGSIECQFEGDGVWLVANKPIAYSSGFARLLRDVLATDWEGVEIGRDSFENVHLAEASTVYYTLSTWAQKSALIQLTQDKIDPITKPIMLDFLQAPANQADDTIWISKVIALCHLEESFDGFRRRLDLGNVGVEAEAAKFLTN